MYKKLFLVTFLALAVLLGYSYSQNKKTNSYVGVEDCGTCHKTEKQGKQLDIWKNSKHASAYITLLSEESNEIAKKLGHETPAAKTEACLKCHASGYNIDKVLLGKKFKIEDGVQCETCHGAGSNYKTLKVMKNKEEAIANGLIAHEKLEDFCASCHNPESPTFVEFKLDEMWNKIKHPIPQTK